MIVSDPHRSWQTLPCTSVCRGRHEQIAQVLVLKDASRLAPTELVVLRHVPMVFMVHLTWEPEQKGILPRQRKRDQYPSAAQSCSWEGRGVSMSAAASPQADAEAIAQLGNGDL